jgi:DNA-binding transcriptional ArsR family regulator
LKEFSGLGDFISGSNRREVDRTMAEVKVRNVDLLAKFFHGFADSSRLAILGVLREGPLAVGDVVDSTGLSQSNVSNHLACLRNCGHVVARQSGRQVIYEISNRQVMRLLALAEEILEKNARGVYECAKMGRS